VDAYRVSQQHLSVAKSQFNNNIDTFQLTPEMFVSVGASYEPFPTDRNVPYDRPGLLLNVEMANAINFEFATMPELPIEVPVYRQIKSRVRDLMIRGVSVDLLPKQLQ